MHAKPGVFISIFCTVSVFRFCTSSAHLYNQFAKKIQLLKLKNNKGRGGRVVSFAMFQIQVEQTVRPGFESHSGQGTVCICLNNGPALYAKCGCQRKKSHVEVNVDQSNQLQSCDAIYQRIL